MRIISFCFLVLFFTCQFSFAAKILQSKNGKVLIELEDEQLSKGERLYLINAAGAKIAVIQVEQVKNNRAIVLVEKGTTVGASDIQQANVKKKPKPNLADFSDESEPNDYNSRPQNIYRLNSMKVSALITIGINSMSTQQSDGTQPTPNQENVKLNGLSFGISGAVDYPFNDWLTLRATGGYEPFNVKGTAQFLSCDSLSSRDCTASIQYLSGGGYARFNFTKSKVQAWAGVGMSGKFPLSKNTTALRSDDVKFTTTFALVGGVDYYTKNSNFIPISLEYQLFQNSDTVTANLILLRGGYGWAF